MLEISKSMNNSQVNKFKHTFNVTFFRFHNQIELSPSCRSDKGQKNKKKNTFLKLML